MWFVKNINFSSGGSGEVYLNHVIYKNINGWVSCGWKRKLEQFLTVDN